jgi:hypothetical protein
LAWLHLQLLLGFKRLGWKVLFVDRLNSAMCTDASGAAASFEQSVQVRCFLKILKQFGLSDGFSLIYNGGEQVIGRPWSKVLELASRATLLLNVMGYLDDEAILSRIERRVFLDIDPGFGQMWRELGWHDPFHDHTDFVTLGRNIGQPGCAIPTCGRKWISMPQPVVLEHWPRQPPRPDGALTSIGAWRGPNGPIDYQGRIYGLRVHEFRKFIELPSRCRGARFEQALAIDPADARDIERLQSNGWSLVDPRRVAATPDDYRDYIARSKAELMIPKQMYVDTNSGLLSDRSVYYLASGRPVLARDTGIADLYPVGEGLMIFSTLDEAAAGVNAIQGDYPRHARRARELAEEYFDSDTVLPRLLADLGVG